MAHHQFMLNDFTSINPPPQQPSRYSLMAPPPPNNLPDMGPLQNYPQAPHHPNNHVQPMAHAAPPAQPASESLEQRILDLLYPYRDECFEDENTATGTASKERMALTLCGNLAFLIRHNQASYGKQVEASDVYIASRNWHVMKQGTKEHIGQAGIGVFVHGGNGFTHTVIRVVVKKGESALECLTAQVDQLMATFFA